MNLQAELPAYTRAPVVIVYMYNRTVVVARTYKGPPRFQTTLSLPQPYYIKLYYLLFGVGLTKSKKQLPFIMRGVGIIIILMSSFFIPLIARYSKKNNIAERIREKSTFIKFLCFLSCLLYTSPSPRDGLLSRMPSSA